MYDIVQLLKHRNECNIFGQSPLHLVVRIGEYGWVCVLIKNGAQINIPDSFENTPLSLACIEKPNKKMVELLLNYGADMNFERKLHMDLFLECVLNCFSEIQLEIIALLVTRGVNVNITDSINNRNCMHLVAITGYLPLAVFLLERGAMLNIRDNFNTTPIFLAKMHENFDVLKLFDRHLNNS
ncbi:hypothetical protein JTB14_032394 [Gonioctena quinquepunctata]|nr:hypothetical protein JTB14_032394 [Gonioctena quinquepunctata]